MTWQNVKSDWTNYKGKFHAKWAKLTDEDLKAIGGKREVLVTRLQERYSMDKEKAEREAEAFVKTLN